MQIIDHKRIARNTLMLYMRMGLIMLIGLWTSRVVLKALGVIDFGLYNVVGGIVVAFSFVSSAMSAACSRYYAVGLGRQDKDMLSRVYRSNILLFSILAIAVLILCETLGLWLLTEKMNIPESRCTACLQVYQISIVSFLAGLLSTPFRALITARENMKVYAYSSVIEAILKLLIVFMLDKAPMDRLVFYSLLMMLVSLGVNAFYVLYCKHFYAECRSISKIDGPLTREILAFNGWGMIGSLATVCKTQGVNILLNMFYGPAVNAARGIANQVYVNVYQFVQNYALAFNPQIIKSYAAGQRDGCMDLVFKASRFSYLLLFALALPIIAEMPAIMDIWLTEVPAHSIAFARIMMVTSLIDSLYPAIYYGINASGKVKGYNIAVGGCQIAFVIACYLLLKSCRVEPEAAFACLLACALISQTIRVFLAGKHIGLSVKDYLTGVIMPIAGVTVICSAVALSITTLMSPSTGRLLLTVTASIASCGLATLCIGLTKAERTAFLSKIKHHEPES